MFIELGNQAALVAVQDPDGAPGEPRMMELPGNRITSVRYPEGMSIPDAVLATVDAMDIHSSLPPVWIDGNPVELVRALCKHWDISQRSNKRPVNWEHP